MQSYEIIDNATNYQATYKLYLLFFRKDFRILTPHPSLYKAESPLQKGLEMGEGWW